MLNLDFVIPWHQLDLHDHNLTYVHIIIYYYITYPIILREKPPYKTNSLFLNLTQLMQFNKACSENFKYSFIVDSIDQV